MGVNSVGGANSNYQNYTTGNAGKSQGNLEEVQDELLNPKDSYEPSSAGKKSKSTGVADAGAIKDLWNKTNAQTDAVRKMVEKLLGNGKDANGQTFWGKRIDAGGLSDVDRAEAQQMVSEDGFFGVKQTTERLIGFAKGLVGENASAEKIEEMRAAVEKGFKEVGKLFGGGINKLPEVSQKTYDAVMKEFDNWLEGTKS